MKKQITLFLIFITTQCFCQISKPPQSIINEFAQNFNYYYQTGDNLKAFVYLYGRRQNPSYSIVDLEIMVENLASNSKSQDVIFKAYYDYANGDDEFLFMNFKGLSMKASSAKILTDFIISKYGYLRQKEREREEKVRQQEEKEELLIEKNKSLIAKTKVLKLINEYKSGRNTVKSNVNSINDIDNIDLLPEEYKNYEVQTESIKISYPTDSLFIFLAKKFSNQQVFYKISADGKLLEIKNEDGSEVVNINDYPSIKNFIKIDGNFKMKYMGKTFNVCYEFPALSFSSYSDLIKTFFYFTIDKETLKTISNTMGMKESFYKYESPNSYLKLSFDTDSLKTKILDFTKLNDLKSLYKEANVAKPNKNNKNSTSITVFPHESNSLKKNENYFRLKDFRMNKGVQVFDLVSKKSHNILVHNSLPTIKSIEVYNSFSKNFSEIK